MFRIACLLGPEFQDQEFKEPFDAFRKAGHQIEVVGIKAGQELKGKLGKVSVRVEKAFDEVRPEDFDVMFIPSGHSPDHLRQDERAVQFVRDFAGLDRPILAICHGPQLLISAGAVKGRILTAWKTVQDDLRQIPGVKVVDQAVAIDGNMLTSRQPGDIPQFIDASLRLIAHGVYPGSMSLSHRMSHR